MSKNREIETKNQHEEKLDEVLFMFVDDEMDYDISKNEIVKIVENHTLNAINKVQDEDDDWITNCHKERTYSWYSNYQSKGHYVCAPWASGAGHTLYSTIGLGI